MNSIRIIPTIILLFTILGASHAQGFQGVATYTMDRKLNLQLDSSKVSRKMRKQIMAGVKDQLKGQFNLTFDRYESVWKQKQTPSEASVASEKINISIAGTIALSDVFYKNLKEFRYTKKAQLKEETFLIKDSLKRPDWQLTNKTKRIGKYKCYKATFNRTNQKILETEENERPLIKSNIKVITAWYAPEIPINSGPEDYWGLPGLILEVDEAGERTLRCNKITLNSDTPILIHEPKKGKKITEKEYKKMVMEKALGIMEGFKVKLKG